MLPDPRDPGCSFGLQFTIRVAIYPEILRFRGVISQAVGMCSSELYSRSNSYFNVARSGVSIRVAIIVVPRDITIPGCHFPGYFYVARSQGDPGCPFGLQCPQIFYDSGVSFPSRLQSGMCSSELSVL